MCVVNAMPISASVFLHDDEVGLHHDYEVWLEKPAPHEPIGHYPHNRTGEDNADAHLKRQIMGREVVVRIRVYSCSFVVKLPARNSEPGPAEHAVGDGVAFIAP
jgi:thiamine phosphate synthase YjbQ (UPF0047 family)